MASLNTMVNVSAERVRELLAYDPQTGAFTWRVKRGPCSAGSAAGTLRPDGYLQIGIDGKHYLAHRVAVLYMTWQWPPDEVDHEHWKRDDNRWSEIRPATHAMNGQNISPRTAPGKVTPLRGVERRGNRYRSRFKAGEKFTNLGTFGSAEEANATYVAAKRPHVEGTP
jgi:hypothetical protein